MQTLADRFRRWYEHERDSNSKIVQMLASVPADRRTAPEFDRALAKATHLITAREIWLSRLGHFDGAPSSWDTPTATLDDLPRRFDTIERAWTAYLSRLDEQELARLFEYSGASGRWRWTVEGILTQVNGHSWYHRAQIATLVAGLGGKAVDTDFIFWSRPEKIG